MEETFAVKLIHAAVFLSICAAILWLGWNQPLSYRFLSAGEVAEAEGQSRPEATPNWVDTRSGKLRIEDPARSTRYRRAN